MKGFLNLVQMKKDWLLHFSGVLTWSLISYITLKEFSFGFDFIWRAIALLSFLLLFVTTHSTNDFYSRLQVKVSIVFQVLIVLFLIYFGKYQVAPILLCLIATQLPAIYSRFNGMIFILAINISYYIVMTFSDPSFSIFTIFTFALLQVFAFSTIEIVLREKHAKEEISAINQELFATRFMLKESTKKQERLRISRDLHDILGHQLTALSLNLEVSMHKVPSEHKAMLAQNLEQAKALLHNVRGVVKQMRTQDQFDLNAALIDLFEQLPKCRLIIENEFKVNSLGLKYQLMYCLQEGISNGLRHGHATEFSLKNNSVGNKLEILLIDNGRGNSELNAGSGLIGMNERLADFNGEALLTSNLDGCILKIKADDSYD
ncbi:sensor histidine kinase [Pseudoalteromonas denitrificans]|uniref:Signal transduction histidine kinase n=1 Tax=Pseudoalteromonas denitrificans DSM 6059 TaxID=1123010 RepID=A0A1I1NUF0_9GAMM|nr:histidine kinase [Pseudoalteromonas denitrificans]SFC98363.1 Signal transduction histidine kinase [Pseudoalteromonas denitrificans DSM 6059]